MRQTFLKTCELLFRDQVTVLFYMLTVFLNLFNHCACLFSIYFPVPPPSLPNQRQHNLHLKQGLHLIALSQNKNLLILLWFQGGNQ